MAMKCLFYPHSINEIIAINCCVNVDV